MATQFSALLQPTNSTAALFRAWCQFIDDLFVTTGGWVNTADTGQIDLTTVAAPSGVNQKMGYKIYRMNDALQSAAPVFVRIDFGSAGASTVPGIWMTVGQGSDGVGAITSVRYNGGAATIPQAFAANVGAFATDSFGSASPGRVHIGLFGSATGPRALFMSIERLSDVDGNAVDNALYMAWTAGAILNRSICIQLGTTVQPPEESGVQYILTLANPSGFQGNVGIGLVIPMLGYAQPPATGAIVHRSNDFISMSQITVSIYGSTRVYQNLGPVTTQLAHNSSSDGNGRLAMRYD